MYSSTHALNVSAQNRKDSEMYKAIITSRTGSATGYGKTDHDAVLDAAKAFSGVNTTKCALSVWLNSEIVYCSTLSKYFDDIS